MSDVSSAHDHSSTPATTPATLNNTAAPPRRTAPAPFAAVDADGEGADLLPDELGEADDVLFVVLALVAMAAAWKAAKLFCAVGFTAKTIPFSQCLRAQCTPLSQSDHEGGKR